MTRTEITDALLHSHNEIHAKVRQRLLIQAQQLCKKYYDVSHCDMHGAAGWRPSIWQYLLHRTTSSLDPRAKAKLDPRAKAKLGGLLKRHKGDPLSSW
jgi:hypothetical protein